MVYTSDMGTNSNNSIVKTAASKLREMLNAGKLSPSVVSKLRAIGMLPSRKQYAEGFKRGVQRRLQETFNRSDAFSGGMRVSNVPRGNSSSSYSVTNRHGALDILDGEYVLRLPDSLIHTHKKGSNFDTSKMSLHDAITTLHELLEHRSFIRNGGDLRFTHPISRYVTNLSHNTGVLSGERKAYETLVRQMTGGRSPDWGRFRVTDGRSPHTRGRYPDEMVRSTFTSRDERDLRRLLDRMESVRLPKDGNIRGTYGSLVANEDLNRALDAAEFTEDAIPAAIRLARRMHKPKLEEYFNAYRKAIEDVFHGKLPQESENAFGDTYFWRKVDPHVDWEEYLQRGRGT
jgi:hypothetical protein